MVPSSQPHIAEDHDLHCIRCGQCLAVCPTYRLTLNETDSPRARVALLRAVREGLLEKPTDRTAAQFFRCLLCGACTFTCPSGVTVDRVLELTRGAMSGLGLLPQPLATLNARIRESHNISAEPPESRLLWAQNLPAPPTGLGKKHPAEVVYFVGCVGALFPRSYAIPQSFVQILEGAGVDYALLGAEEWCCGYPLAINGDLKGAREIMRHNLEVVRATGARTLVTTCPSCFHFWKHAYPAALEEDLGLEVHHAVEFLADLLESGRIPLRDDLSEQTVTYHDPCDLGRKSGVFDAPRRILHAIPGVTLVEMTENRGGSHCCGGGGNLESMDPALSQAVAVQRIRQAVETGAQVVVSACQQCERTLSNAARTERLRLRVKDVAEILLEAIRR
ncbi:MAG: (Fe-S)-binding protein [Anaerolineae bacterium]|nr:(Fe-S)-binding protein [Anaerolineae bacterium]